MSGVCGRPGYQAGPVSVSLTRKPPDHDCDRLFAHSSGIIFSLYALAVKKTNLGTQERIHGQLQNSIRQLFRIAHRSKEGRSTEADGFASEDELPV